MKVSVIGCGYLGAVHAVAMSALGHEVVGVDTDPEKVAALAASATPFYEPGLAELLSEQGATGRLRFTTDIAEVATARIHFLAVGTPQGPTGAADLRQLNAAFDALLPYLAADSVVVGKSTVPVGTAEGLAARLADSGSEAGLAWNPEFLREGFAIEDSLHPDRLVFGSSPDGSTAQLYEVYDQLITEGIPVVDTDLATAELVKVAANAFLATKVSFINAMAEIAERVGADVTELADAIGHDARIGRRFLNAGLGFGGGCLPKDIRAFSARANELGLGRSLTFLDEVDAINLRCRDRVVELVHQEFADSSPENRRVAILGLAFKPNSDDIRESPALEIASRLAAAGVSVRGTDPKAVTNARYTFPDLEITDDVETALAAADVVVIATEWAEYRRLDPSYVSELTRARVLIDARNCVNREAWEAVGWTVRQLGRGARNSEALLASI